MCQGHPQDLVGRGDDPLGPREYSIWAPKVRFYLGKTYIGGKWLWCGPAIVTKVTYCKYLKR